ncbi:MAG TPA: PilX N-terminal domain-containing pilus assembly protein [Steroidobacteraceae bacterium]|jgi:Tfp pilus assembly protein PilX|nr:PilX N-terminal domain-containing pilus assembly protein [Steroidobacteraceae bacterium]
MKTVNRSVSRRVREQSGVVLFTALVLLLILTLVGVLLARSESVEESISENDQDHQLALQAAEATLRYAEAGLYGGAYPEAQFVSDANGLYTWQSGVADWYQQYNLTTPAQLLTYGTGIQGLENPLPVAAPGRPSFMIEKMPEATLPGEGLGAAQYDSPTPPINVYRITAYSYGGDTSTTAEVQEIDLQ